MMGSYSAANVFLDALAHHRRAIGKAALSINWGTWAEAGMATQFRAEKIQTPWTNGINTRGWSFTHGRALEALERLLEDGAVQAGVMPIDWEFVAALLRGPRRGPLPFAADFRYDLARQHSRADSPAKVFLRLDPSSAGRWWIAIWRRNGSHTQSLSVFGRSRKAYLNMGFDSLMSIELKNRMELDLA